MSGAAGAEPVTAMPGPLSGRRVVVTRASSQARGLTRLLEQSGAEVLHLPVIAIAPPASWESLDRVIDSRYDWIVFTSVNGVEALFDRIAERGVEPVVLRDAQIAAVGDVTAGAVEAHGLGVDLVPHRFVASELAPLFSEGQQGIRTAVIRAEEGRDDLISALRERGGVVDLGIAYRTVPAVFDADALRRQIAADAFDAVTFTSGSTVAHFLAPLAADERRRLAARAALVSIGPSTSEALRSHGLQPGAEAENATMQALHDAVVIALMA
jgi:uroporphyrinogen III methyltransferase / synthase